MIEQVEGLRANLKLPSFAQAADGKAAADSDIGIPESGSEKTISRKVADLTGWRRAKHGRVQQLYTAGNRRPATQECLAQVASVEVSPVAHSPLAGSERRGDDDAELEPGANTN